MNRSLASLTACSLILTVVACGGGGGGDGNDPGAEEQVAAPAVIGPYHYVELVTELDEFRFTEAGPAEVDATGLVTGSTRRYFDFLTTPEGLLPSRVTLQGPDGELFNRDSNSNLIRAGGLGEGNHLALLVAGDNLPNAVILGRPASGLDSGDVTGRYHLCLFSPKDGVSTWGRVDFDGSGDGSLPTSADVNVSGVLATSNLRDVTVQVQPNGDAVLTTNVRLAPDRVFEGVAADGGRLLIASRTDDGGVAKPILLAAVRAPQDADDSLFAGRYWILAFFSRHDAGAGTTSLGSLRGTVEADGAGGCVLSGTLHFDGSFQEFEGDQGTYAVEPDGTLRLNFLEFESLGGLDERGRHAVLGGSLISGFHAHLVLLARQPQP